MPPGANGNRGGRRIPTPGKLYPNRSDLAAGRGPSNVQPIRTAPGQPYGAAGGQAAAMAAIPLPSAPPPGGGAPAPAPTPPPGPPAVNPVQPGSLTPLDAPTQRPDEPVTAGASFGAGPGPRPPMVGVPPDNVAALMVQLDPAAHSSDIQYLADYVNAGRR